MQGKITTMWICVVLLLYIDLRSSPILRFPVFFFKMLKIFFYVLFIILTDSQYVRYDLNKAQNVRSTNILKLLYSYILKY